MKIIGIPKRNFSLSPYKKEWTELFEQESGLLKEALGENVLRIEHHGSTSIPNMYAKPIIDIMIAVNSLKVAIELIPLIESLGYIHDGHDFIPERMFFVKRSSSLYRTHHLSLTKLHSAFWKDQLAFRNYLRNDDQAAREYVNLKKQIAKEYIKTQKIDLNAKTDFVTKVLDIAKKGKEDIY